MRVKNRRDFMKLMVSLPFLGFLKMADSEQFNPQVIIEWDLRTGEVTKMKGCYVDEYGILHVGIKKEAFCYELAK